MKISILWQNKGIALPLVLMLLAVLSVIAGSTIILATRGRAKENMDMVLQFKYQGLSYGALKRAERYMEDNNCNGGNCPSTTLSFRVEGKLVTINLSDVAGP